MVGSLEETASGPGPPPAPPGVERQTGASPRREPKSGKRVSNNKGCLLDTSTTSQHLFAGCRSTVERELDDAPSHPVGVGRTQARATWQHIAPLCLPPQSSLSRSHNSDLQ